ncbi:hypothetical protein Aab01nite_61750 [Paractinoplanes abujensis]|uniref:Uncharacterized protein n=1 Tax=Paractinoplanes abujensis TaxID=882441 RepID=A0A7W7CT71_9ACTN|nr:hypothetical protein [Actinoplanes abujensis]MBB4692915.1 hypothetical protein [Actinoplanes abujensis]GID22585.1 hypothetical protein Aab01nite_61750 [Actinoplanes abujensis]
MTEDEIDEVIRAADPYRRFDVGAEKHALLEEIMGDKPRLSLVRRLAPALAAAAAVTGLLAVTIVLRGDPAAPPAPEAAPAASLPATAGTGVTFSPVALAAAEKNPRLLIDEPGWTAEHVHGFAEESGEVAFVQGDRDLQMTWYPADQYDSYHVDREHVSRPEATTVAGRDADIFTYSANDFAAMLEPADGTFVEMRTGGAWTRSTFDRMLTRVKQADVQTWLAALPASIVTPERENEALAKVLADIPLPPGFDKSVLTGLGVNDPYQFGAQVTGPVACGWLAEHARAKQAGDSAALARATQALRGTRNWKVLKEMQAPGDWSEVLWEYADQAVAGQEPRGYKEGLGCK